MKMYDGSNGERRNKIIGNGSLHVLPFLMGTSEEARTRKVISLTELWEMQYK